jgi:O-antigen/teichoic acid export membrane protein
LSDDQGLARGAMRGTMWNTATFMLGKGLLLVSTMVLARLLAPDDFGLMAIGLLFMAYLDALGDLGVGPAVIYRQRDSLRDTSTAQLMAAGTGSALAALTALTAPWVAAFFDEPRAASIIQVLAVSFLIHMLGSVHDARLQRDLDFKRRFGPEVGKAFVKSAVSIVLAVLGFGVWSLVWGQVAGTVVGTALYWRVAGFGFRPELDLGTARSLLRFGLPMTLLGLLGIVIQNLDYLIIGRRLDATALGYYTIAFRVPELLLMNLCYILSQALFPAYAKLRDDPEALRNGFARTLRYVTVVTAPVGVGLAVVAPEVMLLTFGPQWEPAIPVMQVLAVYALLYSISFNVGDVYKATGRPGVLNVISTIKIAVTAPLLWFLAAEGIVAVAVGMALSAAIMSAVELVIASRLLHVRLTFMLREFLPAVVAVCIMLAGTLGMRVVLADAVLVLRLAGIIATGVILYSAALWMISPATVRGIVDLLKRTPSVPSTGK